ncbi:alpha/beta fold hydrolase [Sinorhizobium meliloti]|uniref:alpha/beta fold hydrolase n=1 Tax=Rhizobium meliloti TaxID=382 RepID=UPI001F3EA03E|nr:alpha/beta hydrolase [Sinorhizobium meliloti]
MVLWCSSDRRGFSGPCATRKRRPSVKNLAFDLLRAACLRPSPLLQDISAATLILRGEKDTIATEEHQAQMKDAIDGAELISVPGHGHNIHWEAPEKVAHLILTFLERP